MKKIVCFFAAALVGVLMASCGSSGEEQTKKIAEDKFDIECVPSCIDLGIEDSVTLMLVNADPNSKKGWEVRMVCSVGCLKYWEDLVKEHPCKEKDSENDITVAGKNYQNKGELHVQYRDKNGMTISTSSVYGGDFEIPSEESESIFLSKTVTFSNFMGVGRTDYETAKALFDKVDGGELKLQLTEFWTASPSSSASSCSSDVDDDDLDALDKALDAYDAALDAYEDAVEASGTHSAAKAAKAYKKAAKAAKALEDMGY